MLAQLCRKAGLQLPRPQSRRSSNSFCISCISRFSFLQSTTKKSKITLGQLRFKTLPCHDDYCKAEPHFIITFGIAGISKGEKTRRKNEWRTFFFLKWRGWLYCIKNSHFCYYFCTPFEIFIFCPKIQLWFPEKIVEFFWGEKLVKMLWLWAF